MTPSIKPEHPVQIGQRFLGKYEILKHLGRGGMGTVFEARHLLTGASWAIKFLFTDRLSDPTQIRDFHREARLISMVNHPNVVKVVDFDIVSESSPQSPPQYAYMVMELLAGVDMAKILRRENPGKTAIPRPMDPTRFMILTRQILTAIDTIHSAGIVHHDLKPANIMVIAPDSPHEFVKVCDFGIAALLDEPRDEQAIKGTPYYMSPERIQNLVTDNRSDIYALGIIFYEMLAGVRPFSSANTPDVFRQHLEDQPRPIHNLPPRLEKFVFRAIAKKPQDRWQSTAEMLKELDRIFSTTSIVFSENVDLDRLLSNLNPIHSEITEAPLQSDHGSQGRPGRLKPGFNPQSVPVPASRNFPKIVSISLFSLLLILLGIVIFSLLF